MKLARTGRLTIINALIFDGWSPDLTEGSIRIFDGEIVELGGVARDGDIVIDAHGRVVVPGLIDAHFHAYGISLDGLTIETGPLSFSALVGAKRLSSALARGFTTVRDVAGGDLGLANAISQGLVKAPRYFFTGPALSQTGGHGDPRPGESDICFHGGHMNEIVDGVDDLRKAVRSRFRRGAHAVKIMTSGGVVSPVDPIRVPQYSAEEVHAVTEEANRRGSYVAAHAYSPEAIKHSVENGVRSIEHGNLLDRETARLMAEAQSFLVPTLVAYDAMSRRGKDVRLPAVSAAKNLEVLDAGRNAVEIAHRERVSVGFGSDLMGDLEDDQLHGLYLQSEITGVLQTLRSATSVNAALLRRNDLGRIAVRAAGDVLILPDNPFDHPSALWDENRPRLIIQSGIPVSGSLE